MKFLPFRKSFTARIRGHGLRAIRVFGYDRLIALILLGVLVLIRIWDPVPVEDLRLKVFDAYQILSPREMTARPVVIVDIDEASIRTFGQWPWPRTRMAQIVDKLESLGALAIGFDIVFAEPDRLSPGRVAKEIPGLDSEIRAKLDSLPSNDDVFARALRKTRTVLGETALNTPSPPTPGVIPQAGMATVGPSAMSFVRQYPGVLSNLPVLAQAATGQGLFTIAPEPDGIVRRVPMVLAVEGRLAPSLTMELLRVLTGAQAILVKTDATGIEKLVLPGLQVPTDPKGQIWVQYTPHDPSRFVSVTDLLNGATPKARIAGKIVLVGTSALGLFDNKTTPLSRSIPGVEIHAQVLEGALSGRLLHEPQFALAIEVLIEAAVGLAIVVLAPMLGALLLLLFGASVAVAVATFSWWRYRFDGTLIDASYPLLSSFVVYSTLAFMNYFKEQVGRRRIRSAFSQYLSPDLVAELSRSTEGLSLGGETRVMSVMFSDVRGFTGIAEGYKQDPQGLTRLMNSFLTPLTNAIIDHKGTIDKYMGDAIMAFWNAPLRDAQQEFNACRAALDMLARLEDLNGRREFEDPGPTGVFEPLRVGIGINTGPCVVGNMGSELRFDYSVLGDTVNLASRLEGQSKTYGVKVILGDATAYAVRESFAVLEIDLLLVKGKSEPEPVWTLLGGMDMVLDQTFQQLANVHRLLLSQYRAGDFDQALDALDRCRLRGRHFGLETLYDLYRARIETYLLAPPPPGWSGVYAATSK